MVNLPINPLQAFSRHRNERGARFHESPFFSGCDTNFSKRARDQDDFSVANNRHGACSE
jgi:hypothetical protein